MGRSRLLGETQARAGEAALCHLTRWALPRTAANDRPPLPSRWPHDPRPAASTRPAIRTQRPRHSGGGHAAGGGARGRAPISACAGMRAQGLRGTNMDGRTADRSALFAVSVATSITPTDRIISSAMSAPNASRLTTL